MQSVEDQLVQAIDEYTNDVGKETNRIFKDVGRDTSLNLQASSSSKLRGTGKYAKGWTFRVSGKGLLSSVRIYNKAQPSLTYLLENGHMILINGHNYGRTRAIKHIEPAKKQATVELIERLTKT